MAQTTHKAAFYVNDTNSVRVDLNEELLTAAIEVERTSHLMGLANPMFGSETSLIDGSQRLPIFQVESGLVALTANTDVDTGDATEVREHVMKIADPRVTPVDVFYERDIARYNGVAGWISKVMLKKLNNVIVTWDKEVLQNIVDVVEGVIAKNAQGIYEVNLSTITGEALYDHITSQHAILEGITNEETNGFEKSELVTVVVHEVYRLLNKFGFIDEQSAEGSMTTGSFGKMINGVELRISNRLPANNPWVTFTKGQFGAYGRKQRMEAFIEQPTKTGGKTISYILAENSDSSTAGTTPELTIGEIIFEDFIYIGSVSATPVSGFSTHGVKSTPRVEVKEAKTEVKVEAINAKANIVDAKAKLYNAKAEVKTDEVKTDEVK